MGATSRSNKSGQISFRTIRGETFCLSANNPLLKIPPFIDKWNHSQYSLVIYLNKYNENWFLQVDACWYVMANEWLKLIYLKVIWHNRRSLNTFPECRKIRKALSKKLAQLFHKNTGMFWVCFQHFLWGDSPCPRVGFSGFLPQTKNMHIRLTWDSKLSNIHLLKLRLARMVHCIPKKRSCIFSYHCLVNVTRNSQMQIKASVW